jgi:hypothetical protein
LFFDIGQDPCYARSFDLDKDLELPSANVACAPELKMTNLALCDSPQGLNQPQLGLHIWCVIQKAHHYLHHLCDRLLELSMLL